MSLSLNESLVEAESEDDVELVLGLVAMKTVESLAPPPLSCSGALLIERPEILRSIISRASSMASDFLVFFVPPLWLLVGNLINSAKFASAAGYFEF